LGSCRTSLAFDLGPFLVGDFVGLSGAVFPDELEENVPSDLSVRAVEAPDLVSDPFTKCLCSDSWRLSLDFALVGLGRSWCGKLSCLASLPRTLGFEVSAYLPLVGLSDALRLGLLDLLLRFCPSDTESSKLP